MDLQVLDPTNETAAPAGELAKKPGTLRGKTVGLISNGKEGTKTFFTSLDQMLRSEFGVAHVVTLVKSNYSAPADPHIAAEIAGWDAVITGIGD